MNLESVYKIIQGEETISISNSFDIAKYCKVCLDNYEMEDNGRKVVVQVLDNWDKLPEDTYEMWTDLIELAGFYPYLEKEKSKLDFDNLSAELRKELHLSKNIVSNRLVYFHEEQKYLKEIIFKKKNLIVSAPTSFGKSLLIEEIVASNLYKNIVVIQPTLALIDETRKKLKKYNQNYKIIVKTSQKPSENKSNLFLLTSERVLEYNGFENVDFLIIDEFYKLSTSRDDERADHLNNAFYKLLKNFNPQFYLLGPNIKNISEGFKEQYDAVFYKTTYSLIDNKTIDIYSSHKEIFDNTSHPFKNGYDEAKRYKEKVLFELLFKLRNEQSIIYCKSPAQIVKLASSFLSFLKEKEIIESSKLPIIEWIKINVNESWNLIEFLNYGIGVNNGAIPKHINSSIVNYFNDGELKYLFCTTTLIEGVNTSAKNMIIFDNIKGGSKEIDFFDHSNIKGRSGRMMVHYVGNIYDFNKPPAYEDIIVDIPFFEQSENTKKFPAEIEISIDDEDIKNPNTEQHRKIKSIEPELRKIIKSNGLLVDGQLAIIKEISDLEKNVIIKRRDYEKTYTVYDLLNWSSPEYDQLQYVFELCWKYLKKPTESLSIYSASHLTFKVNSYVYNKNMSTLIEETHQNYITARDEQLESWHIHYKGKTDVELLNQAIQDSFQIFRHWYQYKVPKWLSVINSLQEYVCEKNNLHAGSYIHYASQLENDFIDEHLSIFLEYGIPKSAINKIKPLVSSDNSEDDVIRIVKEYANINDNGLLAYEKYKINESL